MTGTFLDELRVVRKVVEAQSSVVLDVPGSGGRQAVRFRPPPDRDKLTPVLTLYKAKGCLDPGEELQFLVDCCDEVLHRDEHGEMVPVDPDGGPLRFDGSDERWGDDVDTARDCVRKLYNLDLQPLAAAGAADRLFDWLQGIDAEIAARVEGKSETPAAS